MFFPSLKDLNSDPKIITASFKTLRDLHSKEEDQLIKATPTLSVKANAMHCSMQLEQRNF